MAYTTKTISLQELLKTDYIPDFVNIINSNNITLRSNILDLYNNLYISGSNIGDITNPISTLYSKKIGIKVVDVDDGIKFYDTDGIEIGYIKLSGGKIVAQFDSIIINDSIESDGNFSIGSEETPTNMTVIGSSTLHGSEIKGYTSTPIELSTSQITSKIATAVVTLENMSYSDIIVNLKLSNDLYTGGAYVSGVIEGINIELNIPGSIGAVDGQNFNIILGDILDSNGDKIADTAALIQAINLTTNYTFLNENESKTQFELIPAGTQYYSTDSSYKKIFDIKIIGSDTNRKILVKNLI